ncbi:hypothetical protein ACH4S8_20200 [Streptomyces sp. NPDC021080]|uniref:hypothetical protein n=1 Tax=Streptomyces sp. NPDC021080 TaxID=3365110 RepID=UPI0037AFC2BD
MNDRFAVKASWAWYSKRPGSLGEYDVLHWAGSAEHRDMFAHYITAAGLGNPPPASALHDRLPWVSIRGLRFPEEQWTGISVMESSPLRDGANREITPTRYFLLNSPKLALHRVEYVTLWDAVATVQLPPDQDESIPLQVGAQSGHGLLTGLDTVADHVPGIFAGMEDDRRRTAAALWAAAVSALLLGGGRVVITGAGGALDTRTRLAVFDAVAAFLPYGVRSELAVGSCIDGGEHPPTHLAFGPAYTPDATPVRLGTLPRVPEGRPDQYRRRLNHLIGDQGFLAVAHNLLSYDVAVPLSDHDAILSCLDRLDPFQVAVNAVEAGHESVQMVADGLNSLTGNADPDSADAQRLVQRGIDYVVDDTAREMDDVMRRLWVDEDSGPLVSVCVAENLLSVALSVAASGTDSSSCRTRLSRLWQMVEDCGKEAEVLRLLSDDGDPEADQRLPYVVDCLCALGPAKVVGDSSAVAWALWDAPRFTRGVLAKESVSPVRLRQWLEALAANNREAPAWLRAWAVLLPGTEECSAFSDPCPTPLEALYVLSATVGAGRADLAAETVRGLWSALRTLALGSRHTERAGGNGRDGGSFTLPFLNRGGTRNPSPPDAAEERGTQALADLLTEDVWQDCRAWADVLRCLVGLPADGPQWREEACIAYSESLKLLLTDKWLRPFLGPLLCELARPVLDEPWGKEGESVVLAALQNAPDQKAVAELNQRVATRNLMWHERREAEEAARAAEARRREEQQAAAEARRREERQAAAEARRREEQQAAALAQRPFRSPPRPGAAPRAAGGDSGRGHAVGPGAAPALDGRQHGEGAYDPNTPIERLALSVRQSHPAVHIAALWAPFVLQLETPEARRALELAGRWWEKAMNDEREALFEHLEHTLFTQYRFSARETADVLHDIRRLIVAGRASGHGGGGWRAKTVLKQTKRDLRQQRSRVRELRRVRLLSFLNLSSGRPRRHKKKLKKGSSQ